MEVEEESELDSIRKYRADYEKRQSAYSENWASECKREVQRIKNKNKLLKAAHHRREQ